MKINPLYTSLVGNPDFLQYYKDLMDSHKGTSKRRLTNMSDVALIHKELWKTVSELYQEGEGGIYIDNIGYLCHVIQPKRKWGICPFTKRAIRSKTNGFRYRHVVLELHDDVTITYNMNRKKIFFHIHKSILPALRNKMNSIAHKKRYKLRLREVSFYIRNKKNRGSLRKLRSLWK